MPKRYGIDTSILVRLTTGDPDVEFHRCVEALTRLVVEQGAEVVTSNQVIGEAYIALQHHYGVSKVDARAGLATVLRSGLVGPLGGQPVLDSLAATSGCGLLDRLIASDYSLSGITTLTLDRRMSSLANVHAL